LFAEIALIGNNLFIRSSFSLNTDGMYIRGTTGWHHDILTFKNLWLLNYSLLFLAILSFVNFKYLKNKSLNIYLYLVCLLLLFVFFVTGLSNLSALRESYQDTHSLQHHVTVFHILIRFICYAFFALFIYSVFRFVISNVLDPSLRRMFEVILCITLFIVLSFELNYDLRLWGIKTRFGYSMSILWGILSMATVVYGIWKKKKYMRITGIVLFGITLYRLFFHDLAHLETIAKTIVFIIVGILLLVVSFLYNKFTKSIFDDAKSQS
jgi:uncharacterized membrane protein